MRTVVIANTGVKEEFCGQEQKNDGIEWHSEPGEMDDVDLVVDFLFTPGKDRIEQLKKSGAELVIVNQVGGTTKSLPENFIRFNGWPGFLGGKFIEAASASTGLNNKVESFFARFGKDIRWVPDQPGFISARIVAMIINEAYLALGEGVSSREEIDTAMKLGTNYPLGPFEWAKRIGPAHVKDLLMDLAAMNNRYQPAPSLIGESE
jgi:3-hydroxybutyryl-CoA dehydrogenase